MPKEQRRSRARTVELKMSEPIPDKPENIARACMQGPPKQEYLKGANWPAS